MHFEAEEKVKQLVLKYYKPIFLVVITLLAVWIRTAFLDFQSIDYTYAWLGWFDHLAANPGLSGFEQKFSDYTPLYLYLLKISTLLPFSKVVSIKVFEIVFDFTLAVYAAKIVRFVRPDAENLWLFAYGLVLFLPTVMINASMWGQIDAMPATFMVASVYYLLKNRTLAAFVFLGLGFATKLQAFFLLPVFGVIYFKRRISALYFLLIPVVYVITVIPAWFGGAPFGRLVSIYFDQVGFYRELSMNAPSIFQIFFGDFDSFNKFGLVLATGIVFLIVSGVIYFHKEMTNEVIVKFSLLLLVVLPLLLPQMHERYFFFADVMSVIALFYLDPRRYIPVAIWINLASFLSYLPLLFNRQPFVPFNFLALGLLVVAIFLAYDLFRETLRRPNLLRDEPGVTG